jgi:hypothetical protein
LGRVSFSGRRTATGVRCTSWATLDVGSLTSPTTIASVGHTTTQAGSRPMSSRWVQKLHFSAAWSSGLMKMAS